MSDSLLNQYWPFTVLCIFFALLFIGTVVWDELFPEKQSIESPDERKFAIKMLEQKARQMIVIAERAAREHDEEESRERATAGR